MRSQLKPLLLISFLLTSFSSLAIDREVGNGGDECERRFEEIRSDIEDWIQRGGANSLDFSSVVELNLQAYQQAMLDVLEVKTHHQDGVIIKTPQVMVSCTSEVVQLRGKEKTCINQTQGEEILCNFDRFNATAEEEQYRLVHHEFAGVAGIESDKGHVSDFTLSNQLSAFLKTEQVKRLAIKPQGEVEFVNVCERGPIGVAIKNQAGARTCKKVHRQAMAKITELNIGGQNIYALSQKDFLGLDSLKVLHLSGNPLHIIEDYTFVGLSQLEELYLAGNSTHPGIQKISANSFTGLTSLKTFNLSYIGSASIPAQAFRDLGELTKLRLKGNENILELLGHSLSNLKKLKELNLESNNIKEIPPKVFSHLHSLNKLNLNANKIEEIPAYAFSGLSQLFHLHLVGNKISKLDEDAFRGLSSLTGLYLGSNFFKRFPTFAVAHLERLSFLSLTSNKIQELRREDFIGLPKLRHLILSNNKIKEIEDQSFKGVLPSLYHLLLRGNRLENLSREKLGLANSVLIDIIP